MQSMARSCDRLGRSEVWIHYSRLFNEAPSAMPTPLTDCGLWNVIIVPGIVLIDTPGIDTRIGVAPNTLPTFEAQVVFKVWKSLFSDSRSVPDILFINAVLPAFV